MKKKFARLSIIIGLVIFAVIIYTIGLDQIWSNIKKINPFNFLVLVFLRLLYWILRTLSWKVIIDEYEPHHSLFQLFKTRMYGHAVSQLTPTAQVGSEAARVLMTDCSSKKISMASVIVDKTIEFLSAVCFVICGLAILLYNISLSGKLKYSLISGVAVTTLFVFFIFSIQKKGILRWTLDFLSKIKIRPRFLEKNREKLLETDKYISDFYLHHKRAFLNSFLLYGLLMMLWVVETHLNIQYIGARDITFVDSFIITALTNLALIFPFIPASLGIYEVSNVGIFALLGKKSDVGITLVLIRRIIAMIMAGVGLLCIFPVRKSQKKQDQETLS